MIASLGGKRKTAAQGTSHAYRQSCNHFSGGGITEAVYGLIRDGRHEECIADLEAQLFVDPASRPALSLLGYCYYYTGCFDAAVTVYESLSRLYPGHPAYKTYYAQCLYKASTYPEALKAAKVIDDPTQINRSTIIQAAVAFEQDDTSTCIAKLKRHVDDDPAIAVRLGCCFLKEGRPEEALQKFLDAMHAHGYQADLAYNIALCHYRTKQFGSAMKYLAEIVDRGLREYPELFSQIDSVNLKELQSVGNTPLLKKTALIEAFNLKAAIEYDMKNPSGYHKALLDMPPRSEEELDPVTLHNVALMHMDTSPTAGFHKLNFLLQSPPFPPETFGNLLLLYCKPAHAFYDLAADVMAENQTLVSKLLSPDIHKFIDAAILTHTSPEESYRRFEDLNSYQAEGLRRITRIVHESRASRDDDALKQSFLAYDDALESYVPVLMSKAKIYWDLEHYTQVERIFRQAAEFCSGHETWRLNVAHVFFMQSLRSDHKYDEAIEYYEPIVQQHGDNLLSCTAIVLANLCVAYIMTNANEDAEEIMRRIDREEVSIMYTNPDARCFHLCIVNLVIGTLYCAEGNYAFGISCVIKSFQPCEKKLATDTWFFAKRCFLSLIECMSKRTLTADDKTAVEVVSFLDEAERYGNHVPAGFMQPSFTDSEFVQTISAEARMLKVMFLKLRDL